MYHLLILLSVVMFGGGFALNDVYRKMRGSSLKISMEASFIVSTIISLFGDKKPSKRELISLGVAFFGTLSLFVIPF